MITEDDIDPKTLPNDAGPESPKLVRIREVDIASLLQERSLLFGQEASGQGSRVLGRQLRNVRPDRLKISVKAPEGRRIDAEMNVGSATLLSDREILINVRCDDRADCGSGKFWRTFKK